MVRIRDAEIEALAAAVVSSLVKRGFLRPKRDEATLRRRVVELLVRNFEEERALEEEAERLAQVHARQMVGMDHRRIVQGIMERLASERGFSL